MAVLRTVIAQSRFFISEGKENEMFEHGRRMKRHKRWPGWGDGHPGAPGHAVKNKRIHSGRSGEYCVLVGPIPHIPTKKRGGLVMPTTIGRVECRNFSAPNEVRTFEKGKVEIVNVGGATIGRATFEPGWKWSTCVKPIAKTGSCQAAHFGYQVSGTMVTRMDDGTESTTRAGDAVSLPPGHDAWVVGNEPVVFVDFQGMVDYAKKR